MANTVKEVFNTLTKNFISNLEMTLDSAESVNNQLFEIHKKTNRSKVEERLLIQNMMLLQKFCSSTINQKEQLDHLRYLFSSMHDNTNYDYIAEECTKMGETFSKNLNIYSIIKKNIEKVPSIYTETTQNISTFLRCLDLHKDLSSKLADICKKLSTTLKSVSTTTENISTSGASRSSSSTTVKTTKRKSSSCKGARATKKDSPVVFLSYSSPKSSKSHPLLDNHTNFQSYMQNTTLTSFEDRVNFCMSYERIVSNPTPKVSPPRIDSVQFSAVAPNNVVPGKYIPINIVMYENNYRKAVDEIINNIGKNAKESKSGYHNATRGSIVRVVLTSNDIDINDNEEKEIWDGNYLNFEFAVKIPHDFSENQILFFATVYIDDLIATKLKLILDCKKNNEIKITRNDILSAFISYAHNDRAHVATIIQGMKKIRPEMDIFFDIDSLRSGDHWEETLKQEIFNRDILFLFWSVSAKNSDWVNNEWRYALENKGEDAIEPVPIDPPEICPPPPELNRKHFNDRMLYIIKATKN